MLHTHRDWTDYEFSCISSKRSVVEGFVNRVYRACSSWKNFHDNMEKVNMKKVIFLHAPYAPARLRTLLIINTRLTRLRASVPYTSLIRALTLINACLKGKVCFVFALQITIHSPSLFPLFYFTILGCLQFFFSFIYFKPLVTPLFIQLFCNYIYVSLKNEEEDLMKTVQLFYNHFIPAA